MKITKLDVVHFGKWDHYEIAFSDGVNVLFGENEAGKSTLCAFLFAMFYGLPNESKKLSIREDWRRRYLPWDGSAMEGSVYFSDGGRNYVLTRKLGKMRRADKVSLRDADSWQEITEIAPDEIGKHFFGIGEDGFFKTLLITQLGAAITQSKEDEVIKRLSNLRQSGDEEISYQAVAQSLDKAKTELCSKTGRTGQIPKLDAEYEELSEELRKRERLAEAFQQDLLEQTRLKQEGEAIANDAKALAEQKGIAKEAERYAAFVRQKEEKQKQEQQKKALKEQAAQLLQQKEQEEAKLAQYDAVKQFSQEDVLSFAELQKETEQEKERLQALYAEREKLEEWICQEKEQQGKCKSGISIPMLVVAVLVAAIGVVCGILFTPWLLFLILIAVFLGAVSMLGRGEQKRQKAELAQLQLRIEECRKTVENGEIAKIEQSVREKEDRLSDVISQTGCAELRELSRRITERGEIRTKLDGMEREAERLKKEMAAYEEEETDVEDAPPEFSQEAVSYRGESVEELDSKIEESHQKQLKNSHLSEEVARRVDQAFSGVRDADVIQSEMERNREEREEAQFRYDALCLAESAMEQSYLELKRDFAPILHQTVGEILSELTGGKYEELRVSDEYKIRLRTDALGETVDADYLSGGTYDILYLALRLGIARVIFEGEIPLLVMDDTLLQMDDTRAQRAAHYLEKLAEKTQILYFTCHASQAALFSEKTNSL